MTTDPFSDAIARLAEPTRETWDRVGADGLPVSKVHEMDARLKQIRDAIMNGRESGGAGAQLEPRLPFDDVALTLYQEIKAGIDGWWRDLTGQVGYPTPEETLHEWARGIVTYRGSSAFDVFKEAFYTVQIDAWAQRIEDHFNPPRLIEVPDQCPVCFERWTKAKDGNRIGTLIISWPRGEGVTVSDAVAKCRACGAEWTGQRIRFLSHEIDLAKRKHAQEQQESCAFDQAAV